MVCGRRGIWEGLEELLVAEAVTCKYVSPGLVVPVPAAVLATQHNAQCEQTGRSHKDPAAPHGLGWLRRLACYALSGITNVSMCTDAMAHRHGVKEVDDSLCVADRDDTHGLEVNGACLLAASDISEIVVFDIRHAVHRFRFGTWRESW